MNVNWVSLLAAVVNLFILYLILKRYLFGPLVKIMKDQQTEWEKRQKEIEQKEMELASREQVLEHERSELEFEVRQYYQQALSEIELFKESEIANTRKKAEALYNRIVNAAKVEADKIRADAIANMEALLSQAVLETYSAFIGDMAMGCLLVGLLQAKAEEVKPLLTPGKAYAFYSSHDCTEEERAKIEALSESMGISVAEFAVDKSMVLGFRYTWKAEMIEYSLAQAVKDYLRIQRVVSEPSMGEGGKAD